MRFSWVIVLFFFATSAIAQMSTDDAMARLKAREKSHPVATHPATRPATPPATAPAPQVEIVTEPSAPDTQPADNTPRFSADHVPLPAVTVNAKLTLILPLIQDALGKKPEELGQVFNGKKSADHWSHWGPDGPRPDWFVTGALGADAVGLELADGRVIRVTLYWRQAKRDRNAAFFKSLQALSTKVENTDDGHAYHLRGAQVTPDCDLQILVSQTPNSLSIGLDPIQWHILSHKDTPDVATALLAHQLTTGMTLDEARLSVGEPETITRDASGQPRTATWCEYAKGADDVGSSVDFFEAGKKSSHRGKPTRQLTLHFENGLVSGIDDSNAK